MSSPRLSPVAFALLLAPALGDAHPATAARHRPPGPSEVAAAVVRCVAATTPAGVDDSSFAKDWVREDVAGGPDDRFYSQRSLRVSLGTGPGGGSCIVSFTVPKGFSLTATTATVAKALRATSVTNTPTFALTTLAGKVVIGRVQPIPNAALASIAVEVTP